MDYNRIGRTVGYLLRHGGQKEGIKFRDNGSCLVTDLIGCNQLKKHNLSFNDVFFIVDTDNKGRFELEDNNGVWWIRATQGHSMQFTNMQYEKITTLKQVKQPIHGTYFRFWDQIKKDGLKIMNRTHIHFATGRNGESCVISGMRGNCEVLIYLNVKKCLDDGIELELSNNGVVLCKGVGDTGVLPPEYFLKAISVKTNRPLKI